MSDKLPPVDIVAERFRPQEPIGSGGFGCVWRAVDEQTGTDVAIKFPQEPRTNDRSEIISRFRNECELLKQFSEGIHPTSLIRCIDSSSTEPMYIILEYIRGPTLPQRVNGRSVGVDALEQFGVPILKALENLHRNGFCYLDCRPENVLVRSQSDSPVLIDFNTVEPIDSVEIMFHDDWFKAPEQTPSGIDQASGPWSDAYAAGKLFAYLLIGRIPDEDDSERGVDVSDYGVDAPAGIRRIIRWATHPIPSERPQTAGELLSELLQQLNRDTAVAELVDTRRGTRCSVHPGDSVGRAGNSDELPDIVVEDSKQCVSPSHFEIDHDHESWLVYDRSLNGTWIHADGRWQHLLSETGYRRLQRTAPERVPQEQPYSAGRIFDSTDIALVDPSYEIQLTFRTQDSHQ